MSIKIISFTVHQATKFNDPHESYRNHSVGTDLHVELTEGQSLDDAMDEARKLARDTVDRERLALLERTRLQHQFEEKVKDLEREARDLDRYDAETKRHTEKKQRIEEGIEQLRQMAEKLGGMGILVQVPALQLGAGDATAEGDG